MKIPLQGLALFAAASLHGQAPEVSTTRTTYLPNEPITVRFQNGPGNLLDWVGLYNLNAPGGTFLFWQYFDGTQAARAPLNSGETVFPRGLPRPGTYEVRMYENDGYTLLAENTVEVADSPRIRLGQSVVLPEAEISLVFTNTPGNPGDHVLLQLPEAPVSSFIAKVFLDGTASGEAGKTNGTLRLTAPAQSGSFVLRLFVGGSTEPVDAVNIEATYPPPRVSAQSEADRISLTWPAPQWPFPVEKYEILARPPGAGNFEKIAEIPGGATNLFFSQTELPVGSERCYTVRAVGRGGQATATSSTVCASVGVAPTGTQIAFNTPASTQGNQAWNGALGMEFEVVNPIAISHLGVFDSGSDGLKRPLLAKLFDRTSRRELARIDFTPASPGTLIGGSRFKPLLESLTATSTFKGVIVVEGYGAEEPAGNVGLSPVALQTNDAQGAILFVGRGRFGRAGFYPSNVDKGPANRYAAGSFIYRVTNLVAPGKPVLTTLPDNRTVHLSWPAVTQPLPAAKYQVFRGSSQVGAFTQIAEVTGTEYRDTDLNNGTEVCYRVRAVTQEGVAGPDSDTSCQTPEPVEPGIAYINPAELEGNQAYGGSVGNDFDVLRPIQLTRLGAFDDRSDGLFLPITVRLYDRLTERALATLSFTPASPGELIQGSRFKDLIPPLDLPAGFQGSIVASGYGELERDGNEGIPGTADLDLQTFSGGCLRFVGLSRWGDDPDAFPAIVDGGPANRYAAGTFYFQPLSIEPAPTLSIALTAGGARISWTGSGTLESAPTLPGAWQAVPNAASPITVTPDGQSRFYRIRR